MTQRCDGKKHCEDSSDEKGCKLIIPDVGYNKLIVPLDEGEDILKVTMSLEAKEVLLIDESTKTFRLVFTVTKTWHDSYLTFSNLKNDSENFISKEDYSHIWRPWFPVLNVESVEKCRKTDKPDIIKIIPNQKFDYILNPLTAHENAYLFTGLGNRIYNERDWTVDFICSFDYRWYPFDTQNCPIVQGQGKNTEVLHF